MKKTIATTLCSAILATSLFSASSNASAKENVSVKKYTVGVNSNLFAQAESSLQDIYPYGFVGGFGSALTLKSYNKKTGNISFYALTDRGPNGDGPNYTDGKATTTSKFFLAPDFNPQIGTLTLNKNGAVINSSIHLKNKNNSKITGLPIQPGKTGSSLETALNADMTSLGYDNNGLDPEGLAVDSKGDFWISDEYGPFIAKFNKNGTMLNKWSPGNGLPEIIKNRIPNRGLEGLSISPSGKVFATVQSVLDINGSEKNALFTRIVVFDPKTEKTKMYGYPVDVNVYKKSSGMKIGDVFAINDKKLLIIEQGKNKEGNMTNVVKLVNLSKATDLTGKKVDGKELEEITDSNTLENTVKLAKSETVLDLRKYGWNIEKAEGLTLLPDNKTIAIVNDNDFGVGVSTNTGEDITKYTYNAVTKKWSLNESKASPNVIFGSNIKSERQNQLWLFKVNNLPNKIK